MTRLGARHRSPAPCTSSVLATTATTRPARARTVLRRGQPLPRRPDDAYGWAVMAGIVINLPWAKGDKFHVEAAFSEGAGAYVGLDGGISGKNNNFPRFNGANVAAAWAMDSVFGTLVSTGGATGQQLTRYFTILGGDRALLDSGSAHRLLGQLHGRGLQRRRDDVVLFVAAEPGPSSGGSEHPAHGCDGGRWAATRTSPAGRSACGRSGTRHRSSMSASKCTTRRSRRSS